MRGDVDGAGLATADVARNRAADECRKADGFTAVFLGRDRKYFRLPIFDCPSGYPGQWRLRIGEALVWCREVPSLSVSKRGVAGGMFEFRRAPGEEIVARRLLNAWRMGTVEQVMKT